MRVLLRHGGSACVLTFDGTSATALQIKERVAAGSGVAVECQRLVCSTHELRDEAVVASPSNTIRPCEVECVLRLLGGKGGFGAMLRNQRGGLNAKKTTNFDAMRDLSGRRYAFSSTPTLLRHHLETARCMCTRAACRIRHVNNEKKLKEWIEAAPERDAATKRCACRDRCCRRKLRNP